MRRETWYLTRGPAGEPSLAMAGNDDPAMRLDVRCTIPPGADAWGVPYETWARLRPGRIEVEVDESGARRVVEMPPSDHPPAGPWPVRKVREEPKP